MPCWYSMVFHASTFAVIRCYLISRTNFRYIYILLWIPGYIVKPRHRRLTTKLEAPILRIELTTIIQCCYYSEFHFRYCVWFRSKEWNIVIVLQLFNYSIGQSILCRFLLLITVFISFINIFVHFLNMPSNLTSSKFGQLFPEYD